MTSHNGRHAVVLGSSMAGLLAARVLSQHFSAVTIIERDQVADRPEPRKGQPQTRHGHGLLAKGFQILTHYFPELPGDLVRGGAVLGDIGEDVRWYANGGYRVPFHSGLTGVVCSRPLLEWNLRRRLLSRPNILLLDERDVQQPTLALDGRSIHGRRIDGLLVRDRRRMEQVEHIPADLIVDATGRGSATPRWFEAIGFPRPGESVVPIGVKYTTRTFRRRPGSLGGANMLIVSEHAPDMPRSGFVLAMEDDRWMVTLTTRGSELSPSTDREFLQFAGRLAAPDVFRLVRDAEPLSDIVHHAVPSNLRRRYENLPSR